MLFVANVGSLKDEEVTCSVSTTAAVHTRQAASAVASSLPSADFLSSTITSPASSRLSKVEEKTEVAPVLKTGKRQKRLRNQQEYISMDRDEKKAGVTTLLLRVTTYLEDLEMSGNLTAVREMSGILLKVRELSGKKSCQGKVA